MPTELEIRLFGGLEITKAGATLTAFMSNKAPALLAYLAVTPRVHQRDVLATLLWGELSDADAKNNLRQVLTNLRKVVDDHLIVTRDTIGFTPAVPYVLDVERFEHHLRASHEAPPEVCIQQLQAATTLYRGDFLAGFFVRDAPEFEEWMLAQKARLRELVLHALHTLTHLQMNRGHYSQAIENASQSLAIDPWREEAHRQLMLALARTGQRSAALAQYKRCQRILQTELGVDPSAETTTLFTRLRAAGDAIPHNLPPQPTAFVGRRQELEAIETMLLNRDCRLLTLVGIGGIGKTRLALQAAEQILQIGAFLNGVYFVPLVGLDSPALLTTAIAEACGLTFTGNKDPKTQLLQFLRPQELLLLFDNFEHLQEAGAWLGELLQGAPGVKVLLTSRERLTIRWEWLLEVGGLEEASAMHLFLLRARTVDVHFAANPETTPAIARICQLTQGLPLGVELAAAAIRHYSCQAVADAIAQNLDLLATEFRDVPTRHRSIRAVFDYSWHLLSSAEQQIFLALTVFQGTFSQQAALAVGRGLANNATSNMPRPSVLATPPIAAPALLTSLVEKSLLQRNKEGRLQLHELLRQYGAEKLALSPTQHAAAHTEHSRFYANFLGQQTTEIGGSRQRVLLSAIEKELDNVRAAWTWAVAHPPLTNLLPMIDSLFEFYEVRSLVQEAGARFGEALAAVQHQAPILSPSANVVLIKLLNRQGRFLFRLGKQAEAADLLRQCLTLATLAQQHAEMAMACNYLGLVHQMAGDYSDAIRRYQESLALAQSIDDNIGMARALNNLGVVTFRQGDYADAELFLQQSLTLRRQLGDPKVIADSLNNLGILLHELGEYERETQLLQEALAAFRQLEDRKGIGTVLHNLGGVQLALTHYREARQFLEEALDYRQHDPVGLGNTLNNLGTVAFRSGDLQAAGDYYQRALQTAWESKDIPITLDILVGIAECLLQLQRPATALELLAFVRHQTHDSDTLAETARLLLLARQALPTTATQVETEVETMGAARSIEQSVAVALQGLAN